MADIDFKLAFVVVCKQRDELAVALARTQADLAYVHAQLKEATDLADTLALGGGDVVRDPV